jgi:hypothetical protein
MFRDLLLNPSKSEVIQIETRAQLKSSSWDKICVAGAEVIASNNIKLLGVTLDGTLSLINMFRRYVRALIFI